MTALLLTGTDTGVGKTVLTAVLAAYWQQYCRDRGLGILKLLQTGQGDKEFYEQLFGGNPQVSLAAPATFEAPVAPPIAAALAGQHIDLQPVWEALSHLQQTQAATLVEALGGLGSPVTEELVVADLAALWRLPTVLVVSVRLGAIAQAVANVALARQTGVELRGIVLNCQHPEAQANLALWAPVELLLRLTQVPILGVVPYLASVADVAELARGAANLEIEYLLPL